MTPQKQKWPHHFTGKGSIWPSDLVSWPEHWIRHTCVNKINRTAFIWRHICFDHRSLVEEPSINLFIFTGLCQPRDLAIFSHWNTKNRIQNIQVGKKIPSYLAENNVWCIHFALYPGKISQTMLLKFSFSCFVIQCIFFASVYWPVV